MLRRNLDLADHRSRQALLIDQRFELRCVPLRSGG
jgi:hypothetical protein